MKQIKNLIAVLLFIGISSPIFGQLTMGIFDKIGTNNLSPSSGYPKDWAGGVHTWDVYAEGSIGVGTNGKLNAYITNTGAAQFNGAGQFEKIGTQHFSATSGYPKDWGGGVHTWDVYAEGSIGVGTNGTLGAAFDNKGNGRLMGNLVLGGNIITNNTIVNLPQLLVRIKNLEDQIAELNTKLGSSTGPSGNYYLQITNNGFWYNLSGNGYIANRVYYLVYIYPDGTWASNQVQADNNGNINIPVPNNICLGSTATFYVAMQISENVNGGGKSSNTVAFKCN